MRAALLKRLGAPLEIADVPAPEIGPGEVLVATHACGICGTDLHILDGLAYVPALPHIMGHEPAGVVAAVGPGVTHPRVGDRVVPHLFFTCGRCFYCRTGRDAQCTAVHGILGVLVPGAFAEYFKAPAENLFVLPDHVPFAVGGLVADAVLTALHASRRSRVRLGETAVVVGAGGVGQILIQLLRAAGVRVAAMDRAESKLRTARDLGAEIALAAGEKDVAPRLKAFAGGDGAQAVFECVGSAETMKLATACVMRGGQIIVIGEEPESPPIDTIQLAQRELEIIGSRNGTRQDMADAIAMVAAGVVTPRVARTFPLERVNEGLAYLRSGEADGRVVIVVKEDG